MNLSSLLGIGVDEAIFSILLNSSSTQFFLVDGGNAPEQMVTGVESISGEESTLETKGSGGDSDPKKCSLCDYEPETIEMGLLHMVSAHGGKF